MEEMIKSWYAIAIPVGDCRVEDGAVTLDPRNATVEKIKEPDKKADEGEAARILEKVREGGEIRLRTGLSAVIFVTFVFQGIDVFRRKKEAGFLKKTVRTIWNSALVGILSLVLFPVAFCAVHYMPEILNRPDYLDSIYNRRYSIVTNLLGSHYQYDNEYKQYYQGGMSDLDGMTFAEALTFCLGRIIPGADYIIPDYFYEKAEQNKKDRYAQYLELGYTTQEDYDRYIYELENEEEIIEAWPGDQLDFLEIDEETKGESELNPYFVNIYEASSMEIRSAIHQFAVERLNWTGHEYGEFQFYEGYAYTMELTVLPHAHNVFLIMGYNYGIPAMIAFIAMFAAAVVSSVRTYLKTKRLEELLPSMLIIGMSIFGMYELAFDFLYDNAYTVMILFCVVGLKNDVCKKTPVADHTLAGDRREMNETV